MTAAQLCAKSWEAVTFPVEGVDGGSLSMVLVQVG